MGILSDILGSSKKSNPYKAAMPYMQQVPGVTSQYYDPYIQMGETGQNIMGDLQGQFGSLLSGLQQDPQLTQQYQSMAYDPASYQQQLGAGFQADPGYQWDRDQQMQAQSQAMAAGGMAGSPQHEQLAQQLSSNLANQQYQNYMGNQMGIAGAGLGGLQSQQQGGMQLGQMGLGGLQNLMSSGLQYGYGASDQSAQSLINNLMSQANLAGGQAQDYRNRLQGGIGSAVGLGADLMGGFL